MTLKDEIENLIVVYTSTSGANGSFIAKRILKIFKKRTEGLIKFHEDRIEELKKQITKHEQMKELSEGPQYADSLIDHCKDNIRREKESIMTIEHWFEDVI